MWLVKDHFTFSFSHVSPWHSPHAERQLSPCFRQEHWLVAQGAFEDILQLHLITFSRLSGATALSVLIGVIILSTIIQPQLHGFSCTSSLSSSIFQATICKWTRNPWKNAALSVGGILSGSTFPLQHISRYFLWLKKNKGERRFSPFSQMFVVV